MSVKPALDLHVTLHLPLHELLQFAVHVEVIEEKRRVRLEHARHLAADLTVFVLRREVAETGKEVDYPAEGGVAERELAHVGTRDTRRAAGAEQDVREVASDCAITGGIELLHVPADAACEVEHGAANEAELLTHERDLLPRLVLIAMRIELEVLLAEPFLVPSHDYAITQACLRAAASCRTPFINVRDDPRSSSHSRVRPAARLRATRSRGASTQAASAALRDRATRRECRPSRRTGCP